MHISPLGLIQRPCCRCHNFYSDLNRCYVNAMYHHGHVRTSSRNCFRMPAFTSSALGLNRLGRQTIAARKGTCMSTAVSNEKGSAVVVALTREVGKNSKLREATTKALADVSTVELPCVTTTTTEERQNLPKSLQEPFHWIVISSPESANVFVESWRKGGEPKIGQIAAIGAATGEVLQRAGLHIGFQPSKATFRYLAAELPDPSQCGGDVLYPASAKASDNNVRMLEERGFKVCRINTYSTETALWSDAERAMYELVDVATFASPTTVNGWVKNISRKRDLPVACIGETSAAAAKSAGFTRVFYPKSPGLVGWVDSIRQASACKDGP